MKKYALVIDDEPEMCEILQYFLESMAYRVVIATNGKDGLAELAKKPIPDIIITDSVMPKMDGVEFVMRARLYLPDVPIILVSGNATPSTIAFAERKGAWGYLAKPFTLEEFQRCVEKINARELAKKNRPKIQLTG